jgi:hypothetical protein
MRKRPEPASANSRAIVEQRRAAGRLTWAGPAAMLFARSGFAIASAALVSALLARQGETDPWHAAARWFPVYATLIDAGCLALLAMLMRREGGRLADLVGFDRARLARDARNGLLLTVPSLVFILGGIAGASLLVYGTPQPPVSIFSPLPLPAALYAALVFPLIWGFTEQMTYNGYLATRIQVLSGTPVAVALVAFAWSFQHVVMPVRFDADYMLYRMIAPIPFSLFVIVAYLRFRNLMPFAIAHWIMDGADAFKSSLWPLLQSHAQA